MTYDPSLAVGAPYNIPTEHLADWSLCVDSINPVQPPPYHPAFGYGHRLPQGMWTWDRRGGPYRDVFMARLCRCETTRIYDDPVRLFDYEWSHNDFTHIADHVKSLGENLRLIVYEDRSGNYIMRSSSYFLEACRALGIAEVDCFVIQTSGGFAKNRTFYIREALEQGIKISDEVLREYNSSDFPMSAPLICPDYDPRTLHYVRMLGQNTRNRLEAILEHINGNPEPLRQVVAWENSLKP